VTDFGNNLVKLTDARGNAYLFTYDSRNRKTAMIYPDGSHENWTYDAAGNVATYTTRAGQVKTSTYDNLNRLTAIDWSDSTPDMTMTYDAVGRLLTMNNGVSALSYAYNDANQLTSETQNITGAVGPAVVGYSCNAATAPVYDSNGNLASCVRCGECADRRQRIGSSARNPTRVEREILQTDRVPRRLHLKRIGDPIWIFRVASVPVGGREIAAHVTFHIAFAALLQLAPELRVAAGVDNCIHVHVRGDVLRELGPIAGKHIDDARRQIARRDNFGKRQRRQWLCGRGEHNRAVAAQNHRRDE
jgi:YD repeat-containing protein